MQLRIKIGGVAVMVNGVAEDRVSEVVQRALGAARVAGEPVEVREEWCVLCWEGAELAGWATLGQCGVTSATSLSSSLSSTSSQDVPTLRLKQHLRVPAPPLRSTFSRSKQLRPAKLSPRPVLPTSAPASASSGTYSLDSEEDVCTPRPHRSPSKLSSPRPTIRDAHRIELGKLGKLVGHKKGEGSSGSVGSGVKCVSPVAAAVKVKTTTGKMIKVAVAPTESMNSVMQKVRQKWTLASGEHCLAKARDTLPLVPLKQTLTAELCGIGPGTVLALTAATALCPAYDAALLDNLCEMHSPRSFQPEVKGVRVRVPDGRVVRLRSMSYEKSSVADIVNVIRLKIGCGAGMCLYSRGVGVGVALDGRVSLVQNGVASGELVVLAPAPDSNSADVSATLAEDTTSRAPHSGRESFLPPAVPFAKHVERSGAGGNPAPGNGNAGGGTAGALLTATMAQSPLCQFTLCSLSPIFGPILPTSLSLPTC